MFKLNCPECGKTSLIFWSQVTHVTNDETGIQVGVTCWCGADTTIETGRAMVAA